MKKSIRTLALFLCAVLVCTSLAACGEKKLSGTYKALTAGTGAAYTFDGDKATVDIMVLGAVVTSFTGTYELNDARNKITFYFGDTTSDDAKNYSGTFDFSEGENTLTIGMLTYTKEASK